MMYRPVVSTRARIAVEPSELPQTWIAKSCVNWRRKLALARAGATMPVVIPPSCWAFTSHVLALEAKVAGGMVQYVTLVKGLAGSLKASAAAGGITMPL